MSREEEIEAIRSTIIAEEQSFLVRLVAVIGGAAVLIWAYTAYTASKYSDEAVEALDGQPSAETLRAAFDVLSSPHLFSGLEVPGSLVPDGEPVIAGMSEEAVVDAFAKGTAFSLINEAKVAGDSAAALVRKADGGKLTDDDIAKARAADPRLAQYLFLRSRGFAPGVMDATRTKECQAYAPCVAAVLERRHPDSYNSLVLLHRYGRGLEFSARTTSFARRRLAHYVKVRGEAWARGLGPLKADVELIRSLRDVQRQALANGRITAIFLTASAFVLAFFLWFFRPRRDDELEASPDQDSSGADQASAATGGAS